MRMVVHFGSAIVFLFFNPFWSSMLNAMLNGEYYRKRAVKRRTFSFGRILASMLHNFLCRIRGDDEKKCPQNY